MSVSIEEFNKLRDSIPVTKDSILSDNELQSVFLTYPALLVANADGVFDAEEKCELFSICEQLVADETPESLRPARIAEIYHVSCSLLEQVENNNDRILTMIRDEIADQPESKELLLEMMVGVADSSDGISAVEQEVIDNLKQFLKL
jgi:tellurite resistance protein